MLDVGRSCRSCISGCWSLPNVPPVARRAQGVGNHPGIFPLTTSLGKPVCRPASGFGKPAGQEAICRDSEGVGCLRLVQCWMLQNAASERLGRLRGRNWGPSAASGTSYSLTRSLLVAGGQWANRRSRSAASWLPRFLWIHGRIRYASGSCASNRSMCRSMSARAFPHPGVGSRV